MNTLVSSLFTRNAPTLLIATLALASASQLGAQTAVSNLNEGLGGSVFSVGNNGSVRTLVFSFTTGASAASFDFTGVSVNFHTAVGSPTGLSLGLYSSNTTGTAFGLTSTTTNDATVLNVIGSTAPMATLALVGGSQPTTTGLFSFSGSTSLLPSTVYYLKFTAVGTGSGTSYYLKESATANQTGLTGWLIGDRSFVNDNGGWLASGGAYGTGAIPSFSVQASAIPEPSTYAAIAGAAMLGLAVWQRRRKSAPASVVTAPVAL